MFHSKPKTENQKLNTKKFGAITMFTRSHAKSQNWISSVYVILLSIIPQTIHIIPLFQVFLSQNIGVPDQNSRRSRGVPSQFPGRSKFCSKSDPPFCSSFCPKSLIVPSARETTLKLHQNYTGFTMEWVRIARGMPREHLEKYNSP